VKFLLDENVPVKLKYVFTDRKIHCVTIKEEGWLGIKNGELSNKLKHHHFILVTRDKDFTFLWEKYKIQVIYLAIEPATLDFIQPKLKDLLDNWNYDISMPFLLMLQKDSIRFWH
jgi:predicted nuclease of predicted toxin-antitoxin system